MTENPTGTGAGREPRRYGSGRLESLSDGVFAFAITLLVLDLVVPTSSDRVLDSMLGQWPQFLAYVVSFATIGAAWLAHNVITDHLEHVDSVFIRLNLLLLLVVSFVPFPTRLISVYIDSDHPERVAVTAYGIVFLLLALLLLALWRYAHSSGLLDGRFDAEASILTERLRPTIIADIVMIGIGLLAPVAAVVGFFVVAVYFIVPFRLRNLWRRRAPAGRHG